MPSVDIKKKLLSKKKKKEPLKRLFKKESKKKSYSCDQCGAKLITAFNLQQHVNSVHLKLKTFKCDYENCEFTCSQKQNLKHHVEGVHEHLKSFNCEICDKVFQQTNHLKVHKDSVHFGIKHDCEECTKSFSTKSHLLRHMRIKHGEKSETQSFLN